MVGATHQTRKTASVAEQRAPTKKLDRDRATLQLSDDVGKAFSCLAGGGRKRLCSRCVREMGYSLLRLPLKFQRERSVCRFPQVHSFPNDGKMMGNRKSSAVDSAVSSFISIIREEEGIRIMGKAGGTVSLFSHFLVGSFVGRCFMRQ